jgi:hypothetical protein
LTFDKSGHKVTVDKQASRQADTGVVTSRTGQLQWNRKDGGYFTIHTKGTIGIVGFLPDKEHHFSQLSLKTTKGFAVVFVSGLEKSKGLAGSKSLLVTTIARARNTGMQYNRDKTELLAVGEAPVLLEPVKVALHLKGVKAYRVHVLDHDGNRTGQTVPVQKGRAVLDSRQYKTIYYEVTTK